MHLLLFVIYAVLLCYLLRRMRFFRDSGIRPAVLTLLFSLRVAAGCLHNFVAYRFYPNHGDIWAFFKVSFITRQELFHDLHQFVADNGAWAYLPYNIVIFLHVLLNFLSFDNMYINTLLFCFLIFMGTIALFRALRGWLGTDLLSAACVLLIPSTLYWTACIHKEGLIYLGLGFFFFHLQKVLTGGWNTKRVFLCLLFFSMTAFFRPAIALTLVPGLIGWAIVDRSHQSRKLIRIVLGAVLAIIIGIIIIIGFARPDCFTGILSYISGQQMEFQALHGNSRLYLPVLAPTAGSFLHILPTAFWNGFFQPLPGSGGQPIYLIFSIELILIWLVVLYGLIALLRPAGLPPAASPTLSSAPSSVLSPHPASARSPVFSPAPPPSSASASSPVPNAIAPRSGGFILCCLIFSFSGLLLIGYIIPFAGAIVRYRSLYLPFLLIPFLHSLHRQPFFAALNERLARLFLTKPE